MPVSGRWAPKESMGLLGSAGGTVEIRLVREETGTPVNASLDWRAVETGSDGTWRGDLGPVPAGGPYRLETRFNPKGNKLGEWSLRGDMRHFLGVGDLWIIAGQSNASGYGRAPYEDAPELGLHMLRHNGSWTLASHPLSDATASDLSGLPRNLQHRAFPVPAFRPRAKARTPPPHRPVARRLGRLALVGLASGTRSPLREPHGHGGPRRRPRQRHRLVPGRDGRRTRQGRGLPGALPGIGRGMAQGVGATRASHPHGATRALPFRKARNGRRGMVPGPRGPAPGGLAGSAGIRGSRPWICPSTTPSISGPRAI